MSRIATGTRIGPYEVVSFLAAGGMGEVYRARDERLGRTVAMKVLPEALFGDAEAVSRFEREARAAAAVSHPNLIAIYDVGRQDEIHYLVMDLLEGETLRNRLLAGALPPAKAAEIAIGMAEDPDRADVGVCVPRQGGQTSAASARPSAYGRFSQLTLLRQLGDASAAGETLRKQMNLTAAG
jgi:Protein kinase domain